MLLPSPYIYLSIYVPPDSLTSLFYLIFTYFSGIDIIPILESRDLKFRGPNDRNIVLVEVAFKLIVFLVIY